MDRDDHSNVVSSTLIEARPASSSGSSSLSPALPASTSRRKRPASPSDGATGTKTFVLDTNVLLHDPASIHRFEEHHICIPVDVLGELDRFKNEMTERGANAREVHRSLMQMFPPGSDLTRGVPTAGGGHIRLAVYDPAEAPKESIQRFERIFHDLDKADHRIIACALWLQATEKPPVILVSKDLNMQLKARAVGIECEDYLHDKVAPREVSNFDIARIDVTQHELQRYASSGRLTLGDHRVAALAVNDYALLSAGEKATIPARFTAQGEFVRLRAPECIKVGQGRAIKPMNLGQVCLLDALLDPDISLVTCYGQAGTGKTLLAVAAGLHQVFDRTYQGLTVSRPIVAMGQTVGFLPGSLQEKMRPWLQPVYDALDLLMRPVENTQGPARKKQNRFMPDPAQVQTPATPYDHLIQSGVIEVEALCYIRGRSIPDRFFVLDEAQQLTPLEAKTIVTRMSRGSKLVLVGDPAQIDNPYVDARSNGLVYTRQRMRGQPFAAHVPLVKGERSPLAEAAARLL
ncbi:MAG: PhoH family protein [Verrucomicrobiaceae bacterium]|nr:PhoH family protein [Verrucomicrobiaceae bacterium]